MTTQPGRMTDNSALPCSECGRPAEVEVTTDDRDVLLCWECSRCVEQAYWLPARWACVECGDRARAQVTTGDGLTRPMCHECAGVIEWE